MTGIEIELATQGVWSGGTPGLITGINTDSRSTKSGDLFVALRGPHFDGHGFVGEALHKGAVGFVGDKAGVSSWQHPLVPMLEVPDTLQALGDIAAAWRQRFNSRVIAITGSFGKTTLRSMLEHCFKGLGLRVSATRQNENNLIGVPLTLLRAGGDEEVVLVECGISERGEMERLAAIVKADVGVITGLSLAHGEGLGNLADIAREKAILLKKSGRWCALGEDVSPVLQEHSLMPDLSHLDMNADDDQIVRWKLQGQRVHFTMGIDKADVKLMLPAVHIAADMALALSIVLKMFQQTDIHTLGDLMSGWRPVTGRMQCLAGPCGSTIINDSYNANPASMRAALKTLRSTAGKHFAILGDMEELGSRANQLHACLDVSGLDGLILVGSRMRSLQARYPEARWAPDALAAADLAACWPLSENDHVLIKASRATGLELAVNSLMETGHAV